MRRDTDGARPASLYWLFVLLVVGLALAGYAGYVVYPRFDLPATTGIGLLILSMGAGIASFFSPCSFPLLVTLLTRQTGIDVRPGGSQPGSRGRVLVSASALALGASVFLLLAGFFVALGGAALFEGVTFTSAAGRVIRAVVGALLILLGLFQLGVLPASGFHAVSRLSGALSRAQARQRRKRAVFGFAVFGFGYLLAGFG